MNPVLIGSEHSRSPRNGKFPRSKMRAEWERLNPEHKARAIAARQRLAEIQEQNQPHRLSSIRLSMGLTQSDLATVIGTSQSHIAKIESGSLKVYLGTAIKIADALSISLDQLRASIAIEDESPLVGKVL